jgi:hypothetical protein
VEYFPSPSSFPMHFELLLNYLQLKLHWLSWYLL